MMAIDYDEGDNGRVKYTVMESPVDDNGELIFAIDEDSGVVSTSVCCLDRERHEQYMIKVIAVDGGGLKTTGKSIQCEL